MRRDPPITLRGALKILGYHDRPWLDRLNALLGGVVLGSGPMGLVGGAFAAIWGMVDQKTEAMTMVRGALNAVSDRLTGANGLYRQDLVVAAHSMIALAAYFDGVPELALSDADKARIAELDVAEGESLVQALYLGEIPTPSASVSFEANVQDLVAWAGHLELELGALFAVSTDRDEFVRRYRSHFLQVAAKVPEFRIWADMAAHAGVHRGLADLTRLLANGPRWHLRDHRALLDQANQDELSRPIVDRRSSVPIFPAVEEIFQTPRYRFATHDRYSSIGDENWWRSQYVYEDLATKLAKHFSTPQALTGPLLLLGHPGAGKSLLMTALAARLPATEFTVVRVRLRHVDAGSTVLSQVSQALDQATNNRVGWADLDDGATTIRVVLLDGLDELLQATNADRTGYLRDVEQFQRTEANMGHPVAVVVTSRTLVADRVVVLPGTPVVKIEEFDNRQIVAWLSVWNNINTAAGVRPLPVTTALDLAELAGQPLLLMMLAVYCATPNVPLPDAKMSLADLYGRLMTSFARREVEEKGPENTYPETAIDTLLWRLSVAAIGMLNRGKQFISESALTADLAALGDRVPSGGRLLSKFFFIHAPEAKTGAGFVRGYEFLHATFGEYLVAHRVVEILRDVADSSDGRRAIHEPDDELLFALLSHQPLAIQRPAIDFIAELLGRVEQAERERVVRVVDHLLRDYRHRRQPSRFLTYLPEATDQVRKLAAYSANLVLIRAYMTTGFTTAELAVDGGWSNTVRLWEAGFDGQGISAMVHSVQYRDGRVLPEPRSVDNDDVAIARLRGVASVERLMRFGFAVSPGNPPVEEPETYTGLYCTLAGAAVGKRVEGASLPPGPLPFHVALLAEWVLLTRSPFWDRESAKHFASWLTSVYPQVRPEVLMVVDRARPEVLGQTPARTSEWHDPADLVRFISWAIAPLKRAD
ncbi:NACHT domain-containing protein [Actinokineospora diospyrosa]|uniref:ATPase family associated with various cellular activities (AAA) n=1 Tax=Actinokineospora diospyrosa TaxID=103728 RepID=A0ABT1IHZ1_9PSEU|nr:AAA family ATPase [Actinokineospora diospyrosa]MCP2272274.1 ATPase family associated with various cellular activities (AAA) [Actinokineospora diospyrosa]